MAYIPNGGWDSHEGREQFKSIGTSLLNGTYTPGQAQSQSSGAPWGRGEMKGSARAGANFARLGGGFGDANTDSMKHTFGRLAQNFDHTPQGLTALMADPEFKSLFPNVSVKNDWLDFGGQVDPHTGQPVGKVDVIHAFDPGMGAGNNKNWQWLTEEEALQGNRAPAAQRQGQRISNLPGQSSDLMTMLLASLGAQQPDPQALLLQQFQV